MAKEMHPTLHTILAQARLDLPALRSVSDLDEVKVLPLLHEMRNRRQQASISLLGRQPGYGERELRFILETELAAHIDADSMVTAGRDLGAGFTYPRGGMDDRYLGRVGRKRSS